VHHLFSLQRSRSCLRRCQTPLRQQRGGGGGSVEDGDTCAVGLGRGASDMFASGGGCALAGNGRSADADIDCDVIIGCGTTGCYIIGYGSIN